MERNLIYLNVMTVPAFDVESLCPHTAYSVYTCCGDKFQVASGWTLQDAIDMYSKTYFCERQSLRLRRPFRRQ